MSQEDPADPVSPSTKTDQRIPTHTSPSVSFSTKTDHRNPERGGPVSLPTKTEHRNPATPLPETQVTLSPCPPRQNQGIQLPSQTQWLFPRETMMSCQSPQQPCRPAPTRSFSSAAPMHRWSQAMRINMCKGVNEHQPCRSLLWDLSPRPPAY